MHLSDNYLIKYSVYEINLILLIRQTHCNFVSKYVDYEVNKALKLLTSTLLIVTILIFNILDWQHTWKNQNCMVLFR